MTTTTRPAPWWGTAPNPSCVDWCEDEHTPGEFTQGGGMLCVAKVSIPGDRFTVEAQCFTGVNEAEDDYEREAPSVFLNVEGDELTGPECERLAALLRKAAAAIDPAAEANR